MTTRISGSAPLDDEHGRPMDIATLHADDLLLDRLGRGEEPDDGDAVLSALARWRATLPGDDPGDAGDPVDGELLAAALAALRPPRRTSRVARRSAVLSVAVVLAFGTVAAAEQAGPNSPLWPLTQLMFHDRAEARAAADRVSAARASIEGGRYDQASRLLDEAATAVKRIGGGVEADRLRGDIAVLRARIPTDTEEGATAPAEPAAPSDPPPSPLPASDVPRSVLPPSPADSLTPTSEAPTAGPSTIPSVPPLGPGGIEVPPSLVPGGPLLSTESLPDLGGPIGLVR